MKRQPELSPPSVSHSPPSRTALPLPPPPSSDFFGPSAFTVVVAVLPWECSCLFRTVWRYPPHSPFVLFAFASQPRRHRRPPSRMQPPSPVRCGVTPLAVPSSSPPSLRSRVAMWYGASPPSLASVACLVRLPVQTGGWRFAVGSEGRIFSSAARVRLYSLAWLLPMVCGQQGLKSINARYIQRHAFPYSVVLRDRSPPPIGHGARVLSLTLSPSYPFGHLQWLTVKCRSQSYVNKQQVSFILLYHFEGYVFRNLRPSSLLKKEFLTGCHVLTIDHLDEIYDNCVICIHAPDAIKILGTQATYDEIRILSAFQFVNSDIYLHHDKTLMPQNPSAWSALNFLGTTQNGVCVTYWLNPKPRESPTRLGTLFLGRGSTSGAVASAPERRRRRSGQLRPNRSRSGRGSGISFSKPCCRSGLEAPPSRNSLAPFPPAVAARRHRRRRLAPCGLPRSPRPSLGDLGIREPPPLQIGSAVIPQPPATSGARPRPFPTAAGRHLKLLRPPRPVRAEVGPARLPSAAAANRGFHRLLLGLRRRFVATPTSSGRRRAAGNPCTREQAEDWISSAAPPAATRRRPALAPDPSDVPHPSPAGAPAVRPPAANPSSLHSGMLLF
ncbi:hypothetical protein ACMD2_09772 [Ananas comosus]|uniref:Uncharacterized protein n=1 Tax=Ananas comosus TaxID=4615 RepID=A0A199UJG5_ANACO|nr:hypothetical protein ACMD2_09772 [Ananas comosus]